MVDPPSQAERQSRSPEKPRPDRVSAQCGACVVALLVLKLWLGTFVARLAIIRIAPETRSAEDLIRGSLSLRGVRGEERRVEAKAQTH
jgi:hypothetical protein